MIPIVSVVGTSDSGKTTLLEKLVAELKEKGYRVGVVKHDVHDFDVDHEGKDSWRLKRAGADVVIISSPRKLALIQDVDWDHTLEEIRHWLPTQVDILLSEGYKRGPHPKIEVYRKDHRQELLCDERDHLIAIASDVPLDRGVPCVDINDAKTLADLIEERFLRPGRSP
jgi:molybdopterin-guanine dinucleotide biosynthesis protein MobB